MRKLSFLLFALMMFFSVRTWAVSEITSGGIYYIQNVESGLFLCGANTWGTKASVSTEGVLFELTGSDNVYSIKHLGLSVDLKYLGSNLYTDAASTGWMISPVEGNPGVFRIYNQEAGGYLAKGNTASKGFYAKTVADGSADIAKWRILTKDEAIGQLENATSKQPMSVSFLLSNPGFNRNIKTSDWVAVAKNLNLCGGNFKNTRDNYCAESYRSTFTVSQTLKGIPNGRYKASVQAFYRQDGSDEEHLPFLFANNSEKAFSMMPEGVGSMDAASTIFCDRTKYKIEVDVTVTDNSLQVGVRTENDMLWCLWDNFELTYLGKNLDVTLAASGLSTFSAECEYKVPEGVEAYYATSRMGNVVTMTKISDGVIPANTGVVLKGTGNAEYPLALTSTSPAGLEGNLLVAAIKPVELAATSGDMTNYVLNGGEFHPYTGTAQVGAGKAYLQLPTSGVKSLVLDFDCADGIQGNNCSREWDDVNDGYSLLGTKISNGYKGIVVRNGKKTLYRKK